MRFSSVHVTPPSCQDSPSQVNESVVMSVNRHRSRGDGGGDHGRARRLSDRAAHRRRCAGGATVGVIAGGLLTRWAGWQYIFNLNGPIGAPDPERLVALGALANMFITIDRAAGSMIAAPMPWTARAPIMKPAPVASAAASDAAVNSLSQHQDAAAAEQIGGPAAEQQEAAECERVCGHDPLQVGLGEVQVAADRGQRHVDDRQIDDRHEQRYGQQRERSPAVDTG